MRKNVIFEEAVVIGIKVPVSIRCNEPDMALLSPVNVNYAIQQTPDFPIKTSFFPRFQVDDLYRTRSVERNTYK